MDYRCPYTCILHVYDAVLVKSNQRWKMENTVAPKIEHVPKLKFEFSSTMSFQLFVYDFIILISFFGWFIVWYRHFLSDFTKFDYHAVVERGDVCY